MPASQHWSGKFAHARLLAVMLAAGHQYAEAPVGRLAVIGDVHDVLQLQVIEQEAVDRAVVPVREELLEPLDVEPPCPGLAEIDAVEEVQLAVVREQVDRLFVEAHVDVIPVLEVKRTNRVDVLEARDASFEPGRSGRPGRLTFCLFPGHDDPLATSPDPAAARTPRAALRSSACGCHGSTPCPHRCSCAARR